MSLPKNSRAPRSLLNDLYRLQCEKVMFSYLSVSHFVHGGMCLGRHPLGRNPPWADTPSTAFHFHAVFGKLASWRPVLLKILDHSLRNQHLLSQIIS